MYELKTKELQIILPSQRHILVGETAPLKFQINILSHYLIESEILKKWKKLRLQI